MKVAVVKTVDGELVGTPDHPVRVDGTWREIAAAHADGLLANVTFEERHIDVLYNLEVDAHVPRVAGALGEPPQPGAVQEPLDAGAPRQG